MGLEGTVNGLSEDRRVSSLIALKNYRSGLRIDEEPETPPMQPESFCDKYLSIFMRVVRYFVGSK